MGQSGMAGSAVLSKETARKLHEPDRFQIMIHSAPIPFFAFENPRPGLPPFAHWQIGAGRFPDWGRASTQV